MKYLYIIILILASIIGYFIIKDYQARMIIVNANYQCIYGDLYACEYISQLDQ